MNNLLNVPRKRESYVSVMIQGCVHDDGYFILKEFKPDKSVFTVIPLKSCFWFPKEPLKMHFYLAF